MHKIASNKEEAVRAFSRDDLSKDLKDLDLSKERFPIQRSFGLSLDLTTVSSHLEKRQLKTLTNVVASFRFSILCMIPWASSLLLLVVTENSDLENLLPEQYISE